jgi:hypothetical protein
MVPVITPKPLNFYFRKHKAKKDSKVDLGLLVGEGFSVMPGVLPLVGGHCMVLGGYFGLFSAFEPNGLPFLRRA